MSNYRNAVDFLRGLTKAIIRPRPALKYWEWADKNVSIPPEASGPIPGRLNTGRLPVFRGLLDLAQQPKIHFVTLCASIRVGKTLFSIILMLYWLAEKAGSVVWLDPSGASAKKVSKSEVDPFIQLCEPVKRLAIVNRTTWTSLWKTFKGKILRFVGSGEEANLHGFSAELAIINEYDRCKEAVVKKKSNADAKEDASSAEKIIGRTQLFPYTRKIVENSSPGEGGEFSPIWTSFMRGSQHHCYLPCPYCSEKAKADGEKFPRPEKTPVGWSEESMESHLCGWQRLTFSSATANVPFDEHLLPIEGTREEKTGEIHFRQMEIWVDAVASWDATQMTRVCTGYNFDKLDETTYKCATCNGKIEQSQLRWMLARYRWVAHNQKAPTDRISAHLWRAYAPPELGGGFAAIAKQFIESKDDVAKLISFHNFTLGLPFIRIGATINKGDIDKVIARTPIRYLKGSLPMRPELLTITADKQKDHLYYVIRAWGVLWDMPNQPTWSALIDWGTVLSMDELTQVAGERPMPDGKLRCFTWKDPKTGAVEEYRPMAGLIDSGNDADQVYEFCLKRTRLFDPYKGGSHIQTRGNRIRMGKVFDDQLDLWFCWSNHYASRLYYDCIKYGNAGGEQVYWWVPVDIDDDYKEQLTDEYQERGEWLSRKSNNHLGDCEKMQLPLSELVESRLTELREMRKGKETET